MPADFAAWLTTLGEDARRSGIRPATVTQALAQVQWQPRVLELDRSQPEFTRPPWAYVDMIVSESRVKQGLAMMNRHATAMQNARARYGVPASAITAIWGMESNYGANFGDINALDALATLAHDGRRREWARSELIAALRIIDQGDIAAKDMLGSWAGAMGHTQFIPSVYLAHAVDADGDGKRDIWGSIPDVAASTAKFMAAIGWQAGEPWGVEVRLPPNFDFATAELSIRKNADAWSALGVTQIDGTALPPLEQTSIFVPAGQRGPAFMVGRNFSALMRYNNSTNYALAVGVLAQRLEGLPGIQAPWPRDLKVLTAAQMRRMQTLLNAAGFEAGSVDGMFGPATRGALRRYQQQQALVPDGYPTVELLQALDATAPH